MESKTKAIGNWLRFIILRTEYVFWSVTHKRKQIPDTFSNILCVELNYLGDLIAITPALRALKQKYPESCLTLWTLPSTVDVLKGLSLLDRIISEYDNNNYDLVVIFHAGNRLEVNKVYKLTKLIPVRIGVTKNGVMRSHFPRLDLKVKYGCKFGHIVEDNLDVVRLLGADTDDKHLEISYIKHQSETRRVILSPGSKNVTNVNNPSHMWPVERWAEIADYLVLKQQTVVITGTKSENDIALKIMSKMRHYVPHRVINTCGKLSISELIQLIADSKLLVSVDSGPVHVAAAVRTPVIDLMGPQDPAIWRPWTSEKIVIYHDDVCTKCKRLECKQAQPDCMNAITVSEVKRAIDVFFTGENQTQKMEVQNE